MRLSEMHGNEHFGFVPRTFVLPLEYDLLEQAIQVEPTKLWIIKPHASSQGRGIKVTNQLSEVPQKPGHSYVCSKYIDNPLTFNGFKFDLRIYVAITSINPLRLYIYEEGLTRFATTKYKSQQD